MKLVREPLLHFLIAGTLLFGGYEWLNRGTPAPPQGHVRIGDGEVRWLQETFTNQWRRAPTREEMNDLVNRLVEEELLAREARGLGLDRDDTIVRRRLAQKLTFLVEDTSRIADPGEDDLRRFYVDHAAQYQTEPRVSFTQVFFSPERRLDAQADARTTLANLSSVGGRDERPPEGDPLLLEDTYVDAEHQAVANMFGADFARAVFAVPLGQWSGPVRSAYGVHLVRVTHLRPAEPRSFENVRSALMDDLRRQRESHTKAAYLAKLRGKYGVVVEDGAKPLFGPDLKDGRSP